MTNRQRRRAGESASSVPDFEPVKLRYRHDGLTPARQVSLIQTMAACGCIREACAKVGISPEAVYQLRRRPDAQSFRVAMDLALDGAADAVEDGVFSRAIHGVEVPHYYKGELVGTHRRYDERLAMFILRYRKPYRYGKHLDRRDSPRHPERVALGIADTLAWVAADAYRDAAGQRRQVVTELAQDGDEEPWKSKHLFRWRRMWSLRTRTISSSGKSHSPPTYRQQRQLPAPRPTAARAERPPQRPGSDDIRSGK
jgi:hypothetical protein